MSNPLSPFAAPQPSSHLAYKQILLDSLAEKQQRIAFLEQRLEHKDNCIRQLTATVEELQRAVRGVK